ncbi:MAG: hypothetical protein J5634_04355 [Bacilli bacterium]|nr:hypothetical protein [Bacilli bacterium]
MGLFTTKKKEPREIKEDDSLFIKLWYNPRTHALMVLGAYLVFFLVILLVINIGSKTTDVNKPVLGKDTKKLFDYYLDKNTTYNFVINKPSKTYYFSGVKIADNDIYGTLLSDGESKNIYVSAGLCKIVREENGEYIQVEDETCPSDIEYNYFDITYIYTVIESLKTTSSSLKDRYNFVLTNNYSYKFYFDKEKINKIEIKDSNDTYTLTLGVKEEVVTEEGNDDITSEEENI